MAQFRIQTFTLVVGIWLTGLGMLTCVPVAAQTVIGWEGATSGVGGGNNYRYGRKQNWDGNNTPNTTSEIAFFDSTITGDITIDTRDRNTNPGPPWDINGIRIGTGNSVEVTFTNDETFRFGGTTPSIEVQGGDSAVFNNELTLNADTTITKSSPGDIDFNGNISGSNDLIVSGSSSSTGAITFSYLDRSFTGDFIMNGGTVNVDDPTDDGEHIIIGLGNTGNPGRHSIGQGDVTINDGTLNITTDNDHIVVNTGNTLTLNGGTLNITTSAPETGNDFRLEYGTFVQTGGTSNFDLGDDYNMYEGSGSQSNEAGQTFISGGTFNVTVRDQFRSYQDSGGTKTPTWEVSNGATANITLNGERGTGGSGGGVVAANYDGSNWTFTDCGTVVNFAATNMAATTPHMVNISGNTTITDGAIVDSTIDVVLNRTATLIGDNSLNTTCPTGPGELRLSGSANLYVNQTPTLSNAPNIAFDSNADQAIYSATNALAPTTASGSYALPSASVGGTGTLSGVGTLRKSGSGTLTIDSSMGTNSVDANEVVIEGGTLRLGGDNQFSSTTDLELDGGTLDSDAHDVSMGALTLTSSSTIDLGTGGSILDFTDGIRNGGTLTVANWQGNFDGGGTDQIRFGSSLGSNFLDQVFWQDQGILGARQLITGEIVPVPEPASIFAAGLLLSFGLWRRKVRRS